MGNAKIKKVSGFINALLTNNGKYYHTLAYLNELFQAEDFYSPADLAEMIRSYLDGAFICSANYPNCSVIIRSGPNRPREALQAIAELIESGAFVEYPRNTEILWSAAEALLAFLLDMRALQESGDANPAFDPDRPTLHLTLIDQPSSSTCLTIEWR